MVTWWRGLHLAATILKYQLNVRTRDKILNTYIIADAGISTLTEQVLHCIKVAMFRSPHNGCPATVILTHSKPTKSSSLYLLIALSNNNDFSLSFSAHTLHVANESITHHANESVLQQQCKITKESYFFPICHLLRLPCCKWQCSLQRRSAALSLLNAVLNNLTC